MDTIPEYLKKSDTLPYVFDERKDEDECEQPSKRRKMDDAMETVDDKLFDWLIKQMMENLEKEDKKDVITLEMFIPNPERSYVPYFLRSGMNSYEFLSSKKKSGKMMALENFTHILRCKGYPYTLEVVHGHVKLNIRLA